MKRAFRITLAARLLAAGLLVTGCGVIDNDGSSAIPKPASLNPEADAFAVGNVRAFVWKEFLRRGDDDSLLAATTVTVTRTGDTVVGGTTRPRVTLDAGSPDAVPAAPLARLGFRPDHLAFDSAALPDPGPSLRFPAAPYFGWRLDTTVGAWRRVRALTGTDVVRVAGERYECWAFAESTWWSGHLVGTGATWMGAAGMARHRATWSGARVAPGVEAAFFREIVAQ